MTPRFTINLLRAGPVGGYWRHWFLGPGAWRRLLVCAATLALVLLAGALVLVLPTYWRLSNDLSAIPALENQLATTTADLAVLRSNLQTLSAEAKRQVRWTELLNTFSQHTPGDIKLQRLELIQQTGATPSEPTFTIDALTPLTTGGDSLVQIAQFMANIMRDPVMRRFQLRNWEVRPEAAAPGDTAPLLAVRITLTERTP
jgi:hypothetical protein